MVSKLLTILCAGLQVVFIVVDKCDDCKQLTMGLPKVAANLKVGLEAVQQDQYTCEQHMHVSS
jgi:hypothetical protein